MENVPKSAPGQQTSILAGRAHVPVGNQHPGSRDSRPLRFVRLRLRVVRGIGCDRRPDLRGAPRGPGIPDRGPGIYEWMLCLYTMLRRLYTMLRIVPLVILPI